VRFGANEIASPALHPNGANAAALLVRNNVANATHNVGVGPCASCQYLVDHFHLNFLTPEQAQP
jgi:hypothetical protein